MTSCHMHIQVSYVAIPASRTLQMLLFICADALGLGATPYRSGTSEMGNKNTR